MKVLIFGASGFIGFPAAQALARAGHIVYGVTRSEAKAKELAKDEVFPIVSEPTDKQGWAHLIPTADVVIEALGGDVDLLRTISPTLFELVATAAQSARPVGSPKLSFIYTSGSWVHGSSPDEFVTDTTPLSSAITAVAWRPQFEQVVLKDDRVNGIVIRPSLLYGKSASFLDHVFEAAYAGRVEWFGQPGGRFALIHADDLADVYVRAAEKAPILGGLAIDASNDTTESVEEFLRKLVQVSGAKEPYGWIKPRNLFQEGLSTTILLRPYLAKSLLGWQQKKPGLTDGLPLYYAAWKASRSDRPKGTSFVTN